MGLLWTVYCHTHVATGRRYIGLTKLTMMKRWNRHMYDAMAKHGKGCAYFWNAIRKYGPEAFTHDVLMTCNDVRLANALEKFFVRRYDTRNPEKGFNLAKGGAHTPHLVKNPWNRPGYREKRQASLNLAFQNPEYRALIESRLKALAQDPVVIAARNTASMTSECRAKIVASN